MWSGGLPPLFSAWIPLRAFPVMGLTREGDGEGLHPAERGESGEPEAPRSPVGTAQAHLP